MRYLCLTTWPPWPLKLPSSLIHIAGRPVEALASCTDMLDSWRVYLNRRHFAATITSLLGLVSLVCVQQQKTALLSTAMLTPSIVVNDCANANWGMWIAAKTSCGKQVVWLPSQLLCFCSAFFEESLNVNLFHTILLGKFVAQEMFYKKGFSFLCFLFVCFFNEAWVLCTSMSVI